jgi:hypothetical protein
LERTNDALKFQLKMLEFMTSWMKISNVARKWRPGNTKWLSPS